MWFDNVLSKDEITRQIKDLAASGFAGAEIRSLSFHGWGGARPAGIDNPQHLQALGQRRLEYLSPEFLDMLEHTCAEARRHGLRLAINPGMGWPPGGTWIMPEHRAKYLVVEH